MMASLGGDRILQEPRLPAGAANAAVIFTVRRVAGGPPQQTVIPGEMFSLIHERAVCAYTSPENSVITSDTHGIG
jgi:hypothetical protein